MENMCYDDHLISFISEFTCLTFPNTNHKDMSKANDSACKKVMKISNLNV